ncbi:MAG: hypothetical protein EXS09_20740 [Gemmataceae bacterium]|nr:hypothetical protein [Gemmataceae bacterium]
MSTNTPSIRTDPKAQTYKQTGPRTAAGKSRASRNATKHGLTSRCPVLVGEDPQEYDRFIQDVVESLHPEGAAEEDLARQFAEASWKLHRSDRWEAVQARRQATSDQQPYLGQAAALEEQINKERSDLRQLQRHPASDPPLIVQLASMADSSLIYGYKVDFMFRDWLDSLPDESPRVALAEFVRRMGQQGEGRSVPTEPSQDAEGPGVGMPQEEAEAVNRGMDWTTARVRGLIAEMAKSVGISAEQLAHEAEARWREKLQDRVTERRARQIEVRKTIKKLELQRQDLRIEQAMPDAPRLELLTRYTGTAIRKRDKSLRLLLELQDRRMRTKSSSGKKGHSKTAGSRR